MSDDRKYIDADKMSERYVAKYDSFGATEGDRIESLIILAALEREPAADAVPVVHASWIETRRYIDGNGAWQVDKECSSCHGIIKQQMVRRVPKFCEWCGAVMDGVPGTYITDKQREIIKNIEDELGLTFDGATADDADEFIEANAVKYYNAKRGDWVDGKNENS